MSTYRVVLVTLIGFSAACADTVGPASQAADGRGPRLAVAVYEDPELPAPTSPSEPVYQTPTPEQIATLPPEYQTETGFLSTGTHAYFSSGVAAATASMQWRGNGGRQELTMSLRGRDETYERTFTSQGGGGGPWTQNALTTFGRIPMVSECGNVLGAYSKHAIWNQIIAPNELGREGFAATWWRWGDKERTSFDDERQLACPDGTSGGKLISDPESGGGEMCRMIYVDHYWYYPDTGEIEFRYTSTRYDCSGQSTAGGESGGEVPEG